jgi:hypothetical protein
VSRRTTLDQLQGTPEFQKLLPRQRMFLQTYVRSFLDLGEFDPVLAVLTAYRTTPENARPFAYEILRETRVQAALKLWFKTALATANSVDRQKLLAAQSTVFPKERKPMKCPRRHEPCISSEQHAHLNTAIQTAYAESVSQLRDLLDKATPEQRAEALQMIGQNVVNGVHQFCRDHIQHILRQPAEEKRN